MDWWRAPHCIYKQINGTSGIQTNAPQLGFFLLLFPSTQSKNVWKIIVDGFHYIYSLNSFFLYAAPCLSGNTVALLASLFSFGKVCLSSCDGMLGVHSASIAILQYWQYRYGIVTIPQCHWNIQYMRLALLQYCNSCKMMFYMLFYFILKFYLVF